MLLRWYAKPMEALIRQTAMRLRRATAARGTPTLRMGEMGRGVDGLGADGGGGLGDGGGEGRGGARAAAMKVAVGAGMAVGAAD